MDFWIFFMQEFLLNLYHFWCHDNIFVFPHTIVLFNKLTPILYFFWYWLWFIFAILWLTFYDFIFYLLWILLWYLPFFQKFIYKNDNFFYIYWKFIPFFSSFSSFLWWFLDKDWDLKKVLKKNLIWNFLLLIFGLIIVFSYIFITWNDSLNWCYF